jgi:spore germination cell wall hydrolase CwlJ-like protein
MRIQRFSPAGTKAKGLVNKLSGARTASAIIGAFVLAFGSSQAGAQHVQVTPVDYNLKAAVSTNAATKPLVAVASTASLPVVAATTAVTNLTGAVYQTQPAQTVTLRLTPSIAREAAWLYQGGWPLYALVDKFATNAWLGEEMNCLATAVYFEARGEALEGQLAVARVVMNRAASGKYPASWCGVVKQRSQFSFVRNGRFPAADTDCDAWRKAEAIAELAVANVVPSVGPDVLWYHADYVSPAWGNRLNEAEQIGAHIFYRS